MNRYSLLLLLTSLLLAGCVPQSQYNQEVQQVQQLNYLNGTYKQLDQSLQTEVNSDQVEIKQLQNKLQVTMVNAILFPEGGWELHEQGEAELKKIIPALQGVAGKQIVVAGYTDSLPIERPLSERFPSNWDLSAARATSVVRYLETQGIDPNSMSAVAFGQYHPIASNDTPEGRAKNRRINIDIQDEVP
jgi:chemotaxis protein MotB